MAKMAKMTALTGISVSNFEAVRRAALRYAQNMTDMLELSLQGKLSANNAEETVIALGNDAKLLTDFALALAHRQDEAEGGTL